MKSPIVLLTDFGWTDPFVGIMKGVILGAAPTACVVDLSHELPAQDVRAAAFALMVSVEYFSKGSIFVAVVDPGVGSSRRILWARTARHQFLAPDNGLLSWIEEPQRVLEWRAVTNRRLWLPEVSGTFHGRDIFSPVAARLWSGLAPAELGPRIVDPVRISYPTPRRIRGGVRGEIIGFDRFGNAMTNLRRCDVNGTQGIFFRGKKIKGILKNYTEAPVGGPLALFGSFGYLELSVRNGDFSRRLRAVIGDAVHVR